MLPGTIDLIILILVFLAFQAFWLIPIIKRNNNLNSRVKKLRDQINQLEKLYKK